jgi:hypothetical protein
MVSAKPCVRSVAKVLSQRSVFALHAMRMFASNTASVEKSVQKLTKALEKEIKYENENYSQLEDIETFLNESGFKYTEQDNGIQMVLTKTVGNKTIEVHFEAR